MDLHHLGQENGEGNLANLRRLDVDGEAGDVQPAPVAGAAVGAKGDQQQEEQGVEEKQQLPVLRQPLQVHGGQQDIEQDTQSRSRQLHREEPAAAQIMGGAGDHHTAEPCGQKAQEQQQQISLFPEIPQNADNPLHKRSSFPSIGDIVAPEPQNVNRNFPALLRGAVGCGLPDAPAEEAGRLRTAQANSYRLKIGPALPKCDGIRNMLPRHKLPAVKSQARWQNVSQGISRRTGGKSTGKPRGRPPG